MQPPQDSSRIQNKVQPSSHAEFPGTEKLDEMYGLLRYLKVAIEDIRAQISSKRKENFTVDEIADLVGRSAFTVRRWISEGRIHAIRIAGTGPKGRLLVARKELDKLLASALGASIPAIAVAK